jgi:hypothetical protein
VEDVKLANGQTSSLTNSRPPVSEDHLLFATADRSNHQMDIAAKNAQLVSLLTLKIQRSVLDQLAMDNTKSNSQLMSTAAELVKTATGHNSCQTTAELNASKDHLLLVTA